MTDDDRVFVFCLPLERMWAFQNGVDVESVQSKVAAELNVDADVVRLLKNSSCEPIDTATLTQHARVYIKIRVCDAHPIPGASAHEVPEAAR